MRYFLILLVLTKFTYSQSQPLDSCYKKTWNEGNHRLIWDDFKYTSESTSPFGAAGKVNIYYKNEFKEDSFIVRVMAYFDQCASWVKVKDSFLLIHEQGHFDLTEIYARTLRAKLQELKFSTISQALISVQKACDTILVNLNKEQDIYDQETNHSSNFSRQLWWSQNIKYKLDCLSKYSNDRVYLIRKRS